MKPDIKAHLERALRSLEAANRLLEEGFAEFAVGRAYYAMFYAASAALATRGLTFRRHGQVIAAFGREFVRSGIIPSQYQEALTYAFEQRLRAEYRVTEEIPSDKALEILNEAKKFVQAVSTYIRGQPS